MPVHTRSHASKSSHRTNPPPQSGSGHRPLTRLESKKNPNTPLAQGMEEPPRKKRKTTDSTPTSHQNQRMQDTFTPASTSQARPPAAVNHAQANADAQKLLQKSPMYQRLEQDAGPVKFVNAPDSQAQKGMFYPKTTGNEIGLHPNLGPHERATIMAFEMTNAVNKPHFTKRQEYARDQHFSDVVTGKPPNATVKNDRREQYARDMERFEFNGTKRHYDIMQDGVKNHGWNESMVKYKSFHEGPNAGFDRYWAAQNKPKTNGQSHSDFHRNNYDKTIAIADKMAEQRLAADKLKEEEKQTG